jgi:hypothetical protein
MIRKYLYGVAAFVLAFAILTVSVLKSSSVKPAYGFSSPIPSELKTPPPKAEITYDLPYPGRILPDNSFWYFKAGRDRVQYLATGDELKKAELTLLYSDKRLAAAQKLLDNKKPDLAVSTLTKGEKYLEMALRNEQLAREKGVNTDEFLQKLATAALKHRELIEFELMPLTPEDLKPEVVKAMDYSKNTYKNCRDILNGRGVLPPNDPFLGL